MRPLMQFGAEMCGDLGEALSREWLETNGIGGFASATITGTNTRRYHALLTAATRPPVGRIALLSRMEETLVVGDEHFELGTNQYAGAMHPQGYRFLVGFRLDPFPVFTFRCAGVTLEKSVFMVYGRNSTVIEYRVLDAPPKAPLRLEVRPLIAFRDYHSTTHENGGINAYVEQQPQLVRVTPYQGLPPLFFAHSKAELESQGFWYRNFVYEIERERGLDFMEDLFNPFVLRFELSGSRAATVIASTEREDVRNAARFREQELARRQQVVSSAPIDSDFARLLTVAADQFLVRRGQGSTAIAGYPWFTDWGRDTMIALPGLTLYTGRYDTARQILLEFAEHVDMGMLPNRFPDQGETAEFNTVDATLWYFEAMRAYAAVTGDIETVRRLYPVLRDILAWHIRGTRYGIRMLDNGLLKAGEPGVQLTWMDSKIGDWVVTPRSGHQVEIQALWFNALTTMENFASDFGEEEDRRRWAAVAAKTQWSFNRLFWNESAGCLYDVVNGGAPDNSMRPNQIIAAGIHHSMLSHERTRAVVEAVERELLTPVGLRSLNTSDSRYKGRYEGSPYDRDSVYHQGTVWPWLLGPFVSAYVRVNGDAGRERASELLRGLERHLYEAGLGQISEIFDADPPHRARGCFAQAWSVAEVLRVLVEDVHQVSAKRRAAGAA